MVQTAIHAATSAQDIETLLQDELAAADAAIANTRPILRHLLSNDDHSVFSDEIVARVRGLLRDVARQIVIALGEAAGQSDPQAWALDACDDLAAAFIDNPALLGHAHALAIEWQLCERLQTRLTLDPVLPPLVQELVASSDATVAATAMGFLAAQARFAQTQRRMELPLGELPADLFQLVLHTLRAHLADSEEASLHVAAAEAAMRQRYEERRSRGGLIERLITGLQGVAVRALSIEHAGISLFLTALAIGSGQGREAVVMTTTEGQAPRLALSLTACGLKADAVAAQFLALHPDMRLPEGLDLLRPDRAAAILSTAGQFQ